MIRKTLLYTALVVPALTLFNTVSAQAGWDAWQWMPMLEKAHQHQSISPRSRFEPFGYSGNRARYRRPPSARTETPTISRRPIVGHSGHIPGY